MGEMERWVPDGSPHRLPENVRYAREEGERHKVYQRDLGEDVPNILGRAPRPDRRCRVCMLVQNLQTECDYDEVDAINAEQDLYHKIYTFWEANEISNWLRESHDYQASHDSISRHISKHIPDPHFQFLDRVRSYRPAYMGGKFMRSLAETMRLVMFQFRTDVVEGRVEIKPADFVSVVKLFKEWQDEMGDDSTEMIMQALKGAIEETITDEEQRVVFRENFRKQLKDMEDDD